MQHYVTEELQHLAEQRVRLRYNNGVEVIGTIIATLPERGEPFLAILEDADVLDPQGDLLEQHKVYSVILGTLLSMDIYTAQIT